MPGRRSAELMEDIRSRRAFLVRSREQIARARSRVRQSKELMHTARTLLAGHPALRLLSAQAIWPSKQRADGLDPPGGFVAVPEA